MQRKTKMICFFWREDRHKRRFAVGKVMNEGRDCGTKGDSSGKGRERGKWYLFSDLLKRRNFAVFEGRGHPSKHAYWDVCTFLSAQGLVPRLYDAHKAGESVRRMSLGCQSGSVCVRAGGDENDCGMSHGHGSGPTPKHNRAPETEMRQRVLKRLNSPPNSQPQQSLVYETEMTREETECCSSIRPPLMAVHEAERLAAKRLADELLALFSERKRDGSVVETVPADESHFIWSPVQSTDERVAAGCISDPGPCPQSWSLPVSPKRLLLRVKPGKRGNNPPPRPKAEDQKGKPTPSDPHGLRKGVVPRSQGPNTAQTDAAGLLEGQVDMPRTLLRTCERKRESLARARSGDLNSNVKKGQASVVEEGYEALASYPKGYEALVSPALISFACKWL